MLSKPEMELLVKVARLYHESHLSQGEIAKKINVSRPTVSRMLTQASERGYIKTVVIDPFESVQNICTELKSKFKLKDIVIVQSTNTGAREAKKAIGAVAANYLLGILKPNDIIGISWGTTMYEVAKAMKQSVVENVTVVQLNGFLYDNTSNDFVFGVVKGIGDRLNARVNYLYVPAFVSSTKIKSAFMDDRNIRNILELAKKSNIALFGLGYPDRSSMVSQYGYISNDELEQLYSAKVAGDICCRFFNVNGKIINNELNERTVSISLEELKRKEYSICVVIGKSRAMGIAGALRGGYVNVLITDEETAKEVLGILNQIEK